MKSTTKIEWANATINFWWGCTKISPACTHCYAETMSQMRSKTFFGFTVEWGDGLPRGGRLLAAHDEAFKLNKRAIKLGIRPRVFANSMSDLLDEQVPIGWLGSMLHTIHFTPQLDWLLLTKRPENFFTRLETAWKWATNNEEPQAFCDWLRQWGMDGKPPLNVQIGITVEDQTRADQRIPLLLKIPAATRFLSMEPLLGPVSLRQWLGRCGDPFCPCQDGLACHYENSATSPGIPRQPLRIHQIIVGGESGSKDSRPTHPDWIRSLRDQCTTAGIPFFFKQWGDWLPVGQSLAAGCPPTRKFKGFKFTDGGLMLRVGKAAAGRKLDGIIHDGLPSPVSTP